MRVSYINDVLRFTAKVSNCNVLIIKRKDKF
jgi:hypothetical protein